MKLWGKGFVLLLLVMTVLFLGGTLLYQTQTVAAEKVPIPELAATSGERETGGSEAAADEGRAAENGESLFTADVAAATEEKAAEGLKEEKSTDEKSQVQKTEESPSQASGDESAVDTALTEEEREKILTELVTYLSKEDSFQGKQGEKGENGIGVNGADGADGMDGANGLNGKDGYTPIKGVDYFTDVDIDRISERVETSIIDSGELTVTGLDGKSAYELAVDNGYGGTLMEWLDSLKPEEGMGASIEILKNNILSLTEELKKVRENFQNGCNVIAGEITACGVTTAAHNAPEIYAKNIRKLYTDRYKNGYGQGYLDGAASVSMTGSVTYVRHYHSGSTTTGGGCYTKANYHAHTGGCYGVCTNSILDYRSDHIDGNGDHRFVYVCGTCKFEWQNYGDDGKRIERTHTRSTPKCGYSNNQFLGYSLNCGYSDGQILSATISY